MTGSEKSPLASLGQGGKKPPPFVKGAARSAGGFCSALCQRRAVRFSLSPYAEPPSAGERVCKVAKAERSALTWRHGSRKDKNTSGIFPEVLQGFTHTTVVLVAW